MTKVVSEMPPSTVNPMLDPDLERLEEDIPAKNKSISNRKLKAFFSVMIGFVVLFAIIGLSLPRSGNSDAESDGDSPPATPNDRVDDSDKFLSSFVHLFEWTWKDIERECVEFLGPKGFTAVQISPPNEHVDHKQVDKNPWWVRYQPVSYKIESRSGTREEFVSMVQTCNSVGVGIYVDAILNHMAGLPFVFEGVAGTEYDANAKQFQDFGPSDFHTCNPPDIQGGDYGTAPDRVRLCQLVGLPDLDQSQPVIRAKQTAFLQDLVDIGVAGFRLDAAKHMYPNELEAIVAGVNGDFYVFSEVIDYGVDPISVDEYLPFSDGTDFRYERDVVDRFTNGNLDNLLGLGEFSGYVPSEDAVVFIDNHDTQRADPKLTYRDGGKYEIANAFMLSWNFGYPKVLSSYEFDRGDFDQGPPSDAAGNTESVFRPDGSMNCGFGEWVCDHRKRSMGNMAQFRKYVMLNEANDIGYQYGNGGSTIAYSRVTKEGEAFGFVIINKGGPTERSYSTGMTDGNYCDVIDGDYIEADNSCTGRVMTVTNGQVNVFVDGETAFAIHGGAKLR